MHADAPFRQNNTFNGEMTVSGVNANAVIGQDAVIKGKIKNGGEIQVHGYIDGEVSAQTLVIHPGGRVFGTIKADRAEVHGTFQGNATVKNLINIRNGGTVNGNIRYGRLAMEEGAELSADVRNIPPEISGDLDLTVSKGRTARVTTMDLTAIDPDDDASDLTYAVSNATSGFVMLNNAPNTPVTNFTQSDLEDGKVMFSHDGSQSATASFDVVVTDAQGADSGPAKTVQIAVTG